MKFRNAQTGVVVEVVDSKAARLSIHEWEPVESAPAPVKQKPARKPAQSK